MNDHQKMNYDFKDEQTEQRNSFKEFINGMEEQRKKFPKQFKPSGTNRYMDEQNKMIDKQNLRK